LEKNNQRWNEKMKRKIPSIWIIIILIINSQVLFTAAVNADENQPQWLRHLDAI